MAELRSTPCEACQVPIWFLRHESTGKVAPIESAVTLKGNVAVNVGAQTYRIIGKREAYIGERRVSHFYRCPGAKGFRRR